jgi:hypothetical protein
MAILHELTKSGRWLKKLSFRIYRVRVVVETVRREKALDFSG